MTAPDFDMMAAKWAASTGLNFAHTIASLSALLRSVHASRDAEVSAAREQGIREAAEVCEREARACRRHAEAFRATNPRGRMPLHRAHDMAGNQNTACARYILALLSAPKGG